MRGVKKMSWGDIADPEIGGIKNLTKLPTCRDVVKRANEKFFKHGREATKDEYKRCGHRRWKVGPEIEELIIH